MGQQQDRLLGVAQLAGGLASLVAGHIVMQGTDGRIHHYDVAGYVVVATSLLACVLLWRIQRGMGVPVATRQA